MAHFPKPDPRVRAPRVRLNANGAVSFSVEGKRIDGILLLLSTTGGLAQFRGALDAGQLAELQIQTEYGSLAALVEPLSPVNGYPATMRPFRFIALDDADQERLALLVKRMRDQGFGVS